MRRLGEITMDNFLPDKYEVPQKSGNYMKFQQGVNRFRILAKPIMGWEWWETKADGGRRPVRVPKDSAIDISQVENQDEVKHFWAMPVYNYTEEKIQILEITQKSIQKSIAALAKDKDWGSPLGWDVVVSKSGEKLETEYQVQPKPAKPVEQKIVDAFMAMPINLDALYEGKDPFATENQKD